MIFLLYQYTNPTMSHLYEVKSYVFKVLFPPGPWQLIFFITLITSAAPKAHTSYVLLTSSLLSTMQDKLECF